MSEPTGNPVHANRHTHGAPNTFAYVKNGRVIDGGSGDGCGSGGASDGGDGGGGGGIDERKMAAPGPAPNT